jgi:hypothetical protein
MQVNLGLTDAGSKGEFSILSLCENLFFSVYTLHVWENSFLSMHVSRGSYV